MLQQRIGDDPLLMHLHLGLRQIGVVQTQQVRGIAADFLAVQDRALIQRRRAEVVHIIPRPDWQAAAGLVVPALALARAHAPGAHFHDGHRGHAGAVHAGVAIRFQQPLVRAGHLGHASALPHRAGFELTPQADVAAALEVVIHQPIQKQQLLALLALFLAHQRRVTDHLLRGRIAVLVHGVHRDHQHLVVAPLARCQPLRETQPRRFVHDAVTHLAHGLQHRPGVDHCRRSHVHHGLHRCFVPAFARHLGSQLRLAQGFHPRHPGCLLHGMTPPRIKHLKTWQQRLDARAARLAEGSTELRHFLSHQIPRHPAGTGHAQQRMALAHQLGQRIALLILHHRRHAGIGGVGDLHLLLGRQLHVLHALCLHLLKQLRRQPLGDLGAHVVQRHLHPCRAHLLLPAHMNHRMTPGVLDLAGEVAFPPQLAAQALFRFILHQRLHLLAGRRVVELHGNDLHLRAVDRHHFQHGQFVHALAGQMHAAVRRAFKRKHLPAILLPMLSPVRALAVPHGQGRALMLLRIADPVAQIGQGVSHLVQHPGGVERFIARHHMRGHGVRVGSGHGR